ncbi:response regulator transcription factor [Streptomyces malaysiensis]|uniref:response regulator transcription factor n=1 Tax=Streptomyces malaysiensis TaxID=92644 RepID=UPI0031FD15DA
MALHALGGCAVALQGEGAAALARWRRGGGLHRALHHRHLQRPRRAPPPHQHPAAILSLFETVAQLRATRQELARTAVERERLAAVDGATVADIAAKLHLSPATVRNYLSSAIGKTQTRNRMEAVRAARQNGWL